MFGMVLLMLCLGGIYSAFQKASVLDVMRPRDAHR